VLPLIARAARRAGQRMLVVADDADLLDRLDKALWEQFPEDFLAHGRADAVHAARQPVLLATDCTAPTARRWSRSRTGSGARKPSPSTGRCCSSTKRAAPPRARSGGCSTSART
jgi:hypothetical protein